MNVNVQIVLGVDEFAGDLAGNATELAQKILVAVGGDETKDTVNVNISDSGSAGSVMLIPTPLQNQTLDPPVPVVQETPSE